MRRCPKGNVQHRTSNAQRRNEDGGLRRSSGRGRPVPASLLGCLLLFAAVAWSESAHFTERLANGETVTIVTMGTSLTGGQWRWPDAMKAWLDAEWPGQVTLHNLGVGASASERYLKGRSGLDVLPKAIALKPAVVFIEFAVNDAYLPYKISLEASRSNLVTMVDGFLAANPKTEIIVQTMNSVTDMPVGKHASDRPRVAEYYQGYRDVARERGLLLIDHYPNWLKLMTEDRERFLKLVPDGIHPQLPGYREVLLPEMKKRLGSVFPGVGDVGRRYWLSERSDYASKSFVADVTVTVKGGGGPGIAFFGMGAGKPDPAHWHEPCVNPCIYASLAPSDFALGVFAVNDNGKQVFAKKPGLGDGAHRVTLMWDAKRQVAHFRAGDHVAAISGKDNGLDAHKSHLFFGGAAGVAFGGLNVRDATAEDLAAVAMRGKWLPKRRPTERGGTGTRLLACRYEGSRSADFQSVTVPPGFSRLAGAPDGSPAQLVTD